MRHDRITNDRLRGIRNGLTRVDRVDRESHGGRGDRGSHVDLRDLLSSQLTSQLSGRAQRGNVLQKILGRGNSDDRCVNLERLNRRH